MGHRKGRSDRQRRRGPYRGNRPGKVGGPQGTDRWSARGPREELPGTVATTEVRAGKIRDPSLLVLRPQLSLPV